MKRRTRTWILIADGARARILVNEGRGTGLAPAAGAEYETEHLPTREIGSERPGRVRESADVIRHAYAPRVDWHEFEKHLFARRMAKVLNEAAHRGDFDALVLVAPPKVLGELRNSLDKTTRTKVSGEIAKDFVNTPVHDLPSRLRGVVTL